MMVTWQDIIRFIRCISRVHLTRAEVDHVLHFVKKDVPWEYLAVLANIEGVAGFVYYHMKNLGLFDLLPKSVLSRLEDSYSQTKKHTLAILREVETLSSALEQIHIPVLALQGLSLIEVYEDPGLRQLGDADLMVKPGLKERLKRSFCESGYRTSVSMYPDLLYKDGIWIDIHTHILNLNRILNRRYLFPEDLTPMWDRAIPFSDQPDGLLRLDPYDNFIALAAHALKHNYSRLIWLVDLHELLLKWAKDHDGWEEIVKRTQFWRQERVVLYALILMGRIFELKVPLWVKCDLGIQRLNILEKHLLRLKFRGFSSNQLCVTLWLCNIKGTREKLKFMKETVFPRAEIMAQIFPHNARSTKKSTYAKRIKQSIIIVGKELHQALVFSFRAGRNG